MSENCTHECEGCSEENCPSRGKIEKLNPHDLTKIKHTIAIISGKGGVGKSLVTTLLANELVNLRHEVAILDADVTGPSIPESFGLKDYEIVGDEETIFPAKTAKGTTIMSANLLVDDPATPIVWRGPMISSLVETMYSKVVYGEKEFLLIDMPPGTGDVPLTVFQKVKIDGCIIVTTPQELVGLVVEKSIKMAEMMNIPVLGIVVNMAYVVCPECGEKIRFFGKGAGADLAKKYGIEVLDEIPLDPKVTKLIDSGKAEEYRGHYLKKSVEKVLSL